MNNIKLRHKLMSMTLITVIIVMVIGFICYTQINILSKEIYNIGENRIPDINDFISFNFFHPNIYVWMKIGFSIS